MCVWAGGERAASVLLIIRGCLLLQKEHKPTHAGRVWFHSNRVCLLRAISRFTSRPRPPTHEKTGLYHARRCAGRRGGGGAPRHAGMRVPFGGASAWCRRRRPLFRAAPPAGSIAAATAADAGERCGADADAAAAAAGRSCSPATRAGLRRAAARIAAEWMVGRRGVRRRRRGRRACACHHLRCARRRRDNDDDADRGGGAGGSSSCRG